MTKIILASKSPRRVELFKKYGIAAEIIPADVDETIPRDLCKPEDIVKYLSEKKATHILNGHRNYVVVAADTLVFCDDRILGKPHNKSEAYEMIRLLSGRTHCVISGLCIMSKEKKVCESVKTEVIFRDLTEEEIQGYISTDDPYDKAGGYGIQSYAGAFVREIKGDYYNVVGLPLSRLIEVLKNDFDYDAMGNLFSLKGLSQ